MLEARSLTFGKMPAIWALIHHLSRRDAVTDVVAALSSFAIASFLWLLFLKHVASIDYDVNDILILGTYAAIFFVAFVIAPFFSMAGRKQPIHYIQALAAPIWWEIALWRNKRWLFDEHELRRVIDANSENKIRHNLSLIYRNLILSLLAYAFHSISTNFNYGEQTFQISVFTQGFILVALYDIGRRAKRVYVALRNQEERAEVVEPTFDALLDEEAHAVLAKIRQRSQQEILDGLVKTGVITEDGKLTKKYGGIQ